MPPTSLQRIATGPFSGQDTFHSDSDHDVFVVGGERLAALVEAVNVDLDDSGWLLRRDGLSRLITFQDGKNLFFGESTGLFLAQDEDKLLLFELSEDGWNSSVLASSLSGTVVFYEHANQVWWTDGATHGVVASDGINSNWGLSVPPSPFLVSTSGSLAAGRYSVVCTLLDAAGRESGCKKSTVIELTGSQDIRVSLPGGVDDNAAYVNIYAGSANQSGLFWQKTVAVGSMPTTLSGVRVSTRPLRTQFRRGPPSNVDGIFSYMGWLMLWRNNELFRSSGLSHHLFLPIESEALPDDILGAVGLETGFWRVTSTGSWWTTGRDPGSFSTVRKDHLNYASKGISVSGEMIPKLQTNALVALFVSEAGLMAGLPDGRMVRLTPDQTRLDVADKTASIVILN